MSTEPLLALEIVGIEPNFPPFQAAVRDWMSSHKTKDLRGLLRNPKDCGLEGRIAFNERLLEDLIKAQFEEFLKTLPPELEALVKVNSSGFLYYFRSCAFSILHIALIDEIENERIPHPDGKKRGGDRAGKPGSLEDECARAKGSIRYDLASQIPELLNHYSLGSIENDEEFLRKLSVFLGLGEAGDLLRDRILEDYGLPNAYTADRRFGALLFTALGQVFGIENQETTPAEIIWDQVRKYDWPEEYRKPPLLDVILGYSFWYYDPEMAAESFAEMGADQEEVEQIRRQAIAITEALNAFRAELVGPPGVITLIRTALDGGEEIYC